MVVESNLPGEHLWDVEDAFDKKEDATNAIGCLAHDITQQIDRRDFFPKYFEDYSEEHTPTYWKITSNTDDSFYVEAWIEEREINNGKAMAGIITIIFGLFLIAIAIGLSQSIPSCKDEDIIFYIFGIIFSGFGGVCLLLAGIMDYNKAIK